MSRDGVSSRCTARVAKQVTSRMYRRLLCAPAYPHVHGPAEIQAYGAERMPAVKARLRQVGHERDLGLSAPPPADRAGVQQRPDGGSRFGDPVAPPQLVECVFRPRVADLTVFRDDD